MRQDNLSWNEMFFNIAKVVAHRSKDSSTINGAVIVDVNNRVVGLGYNGFKDKVVENEILWQKPEKYKHVIHAEDNAIRNSDPLRVIGSKLYLWSSKNYLPCKD